MTKDKKDKVDDDQNTQLESPDGPFALILGEPAKGPEDSDIGTIFVNKEYRIRRFVSTVTDLINLESFNMDHALQDFTHRLAYDSMKDDIDNVRENNVRLKREIREKSGRWFLMELRPHTTKEKVKGVVITFVDITDLQNTKEELAKKIEKNKELQRQIIKNDESSRWRIGQFLHDDLGQTLVSAEVLLKTVKNKLANREKDVEEHIDQVLNILSESMTDVRHLSHEIVPVDIEEKGASYAFNSLARQLEKKHSINCKMEYDNTLDKIDNVEIATHLYRIANEATKNAVSHGDAKNVKITLKADDEFLYLTIEDDGTGFPDHAKEDGGMGISIMSHRMELIGGTLEIKDTTSFGKTGATISCKIPIEELKRHTK